MSLRSSLLCLLVGAAASPAFAQTPFFCDGPALGGSRAFSEGLNPLSNPAKGENAQTGVFLTFLNGDSRFPDNSDAIGALARPDASSQSRGLSQGLEAPYAQRLRAYAISFQDHSSPQQINSMSLTREEKTTAWIGALEGLPRIEQRRALIDRFIASATGSDPQGSAGISLRLERYRLGVDQLGAAGASGRSLDQFPDPLDYQDTRLTTTVLGFDGGLVFNVTQGFRLAVSADRLYPRRLWDVYEQIQGHVGLQLDLGNMVQLRAETDTNKTQRFPIPLKQRSAGASIKIQASPSFSLLAGLERREWETLQANGNNGMLSYVKVGGTLFYHAPGWHLGFGMQFGNDRPLRGASVRFGQ